MTYRIFCYDNNSKSGNMLKASLGAMFLKHKGTEFFPKKNDVVFNWGSTKDKPFAMLNAKVAVATNKLRFFTEMKKHGVEALLPPFWASSEIPEDMYPIVCRTTVTGHDGAGIVIAKDASELVPAELYTKLIPAQKEYRIHVGRDVNGEYSVVLVQRKGRLNGSTKPHSAIKTTSNDYVFVHGETAPDVVTQAALIVFEATGMDFGGLDVIYGDDNRAYVLEVNSAPELGKTACDAYTEYFKSFSEEVEEQVGAAKLPEAVPVGETKLSGDVEISEYGLLGTGGADTNVGAAVGVVGNPSGDVYGGVVAFPEPKLSGGDTSGLMKELEKIIKDHISASKSQFYAELAPKYTDAVEQAYNAGKKAGEDEMKLKFQQLLAA